MQMLCRVYISKTDYQLRKNVIELWAFSYNSFVFFNLPEIITIYQIDEVIYKSGINYCALFKFPLQLIN